MKDLAVQYYQSGYGCSQCILKAAETKYKLPFDQNTYRMMNCTNTGFGIGGMCSVIIASVMVIGLLFEESTAKQKRLIFLTEVKRLYGNINCSTLIARRRGNRKCAGLIGELAGLLEQVIENY